MASGFEQGKRYEVVVGLEGERPHYQYRNLLYRGRLKYDGISYLHFETEFTHTLIDPLDVLSMEEVKKRFAL